MRSRDFEIALSAWLDSCIATGDREMCALVLGVLEGTKFPEYYRQWLDAAAALGLTLESVRERIKGGGHAE